MEVAIRIFRLNKRFRITNSLSLTSLARNADLKTDEGILHPIHTQKRFAQMDTAAFAVKQFSPLGGASVRLASCNFYPLPNTQYIRFGGHTIVELKPENAVATSSVP